MSSPFSPDNSPENPLGKYRWLLVPGIVLVSLFLVVCLVLNYVGSIRTTGKTMERALNAQYLDNQNELSNYISKCYESVGVANLKSDKMDQILTDAVKGRYEGHTSAQVGQGQLFSAIQEAYPQLDLTIYDRILDIVSSGREAYKNKQSKLLDMLRAYDTWRDTGLFRPMFLNMIGFPSDSLEARLGTQIWHGKDARDRMYLIVLASDAQKAYETGTLDPLTLPTSTPRR